MWALLACLGLVLLILGTLPIGRFPAFASDVALLKPLYGRILGAAILLWVILSRIFVAHQNIPAVILITVALLIIGVVCIFLSIDEPVR